MAKRQWMSEIKADSLVYRGTDWGKRPCFHCGKNTTKEPAAWTPLLIGYCPGIESPPAAMNHRLCAKCRAWTPPAGRFPSPPGSVHPKSMAAKCEYEVAPADFKNVIFCNA